MLGLKEGQGRSVSRTLARAADDATPITRASLSGGLSVVRGLGVPQRQLSYPGATAASRRSGHGEHRWRSGGQRRLAQVEVVLGAATVGAGSATAADQAQGHARRLGMITAFHHRRCGAARVGGRRWGGASAGSAPTVLSSAVRAGEKIRDSPKWWRRLVLRRIVKQPFMATNRQEDR